MNLFLWQCFAIAAIYHSCPQGVLVVESAGDVGNNIHVIVLPIAVLVVERLYRYAIGMFEKVVEQGAVGISAGMPEYIYLIESRLCKG